jgi:peptidoglycan/LPS O-acetylase OafA/YrhL
VNAAVRQLPDELRAGWGYPLFGVLAVLLVPATAYLWYRLFEKPFLPKPSGVVPTLAESRPPGQSRPIVV